MSLNSQKTLVCHKCGYDANSITTIRCELCKQPLEINSIFSHKPSQKTSEQFAWYRTVPVSLIALGTGLLLLAVGSYFFWRDRANGTDNFQRLENRENLTLRTDNPKSSEKLTEKTTANNSEVSHSQTQAKSVQTNSELGTLNFKGEIEFQANSAELTLKGQQTLDRLAARISEFNPQTIAVRVIGHTSRRGLADLNQRLSQQRAQAVINYFQQRGLKHKMVAEGKGFSQLISGISPYDPRNQRTEIRLVRLN